MPFQSFSCSLSQSDRDYDGQAKIENFSNPIIESFAARSEANKMMNRWLYLLLLPLKNDMIVPVLSSSCRIVAENVNSDERLSKSTVRE